MTGLKINFHKSFLFNLSRCEGVGRRAIAILNCNLGSLPFYLGLSFKDISIIKEDCQPLIERKEKKLATWKGNTLSRRGRLILINSVLSSMPLYFVSFYYLPEWIIHAIDRIAFIAPSFGRAQGTFMRGLCLINWQLVCSNKFQGRLGVWNLRAFNLALLAKWRWRFFYNIHAPWVALIIYNYYRRRRSMIYIVLSPSMFLLFGEEF